MDQDVRILHVEDDAVSSRFVTELLRREGLAVEIERVENLADFAAALKARAPSLILSDFTLPGMDTLEALRLAHQVRPDVPYVFFSGTLGEEAAVRALKEGATDYILKERSGRLAPAVCRALRESEERRRLRQAEGAADLLAAIVSSSEDAILSKTLEGTITSWNQSAERLLGYTAAEAIGQPIALIIPKHLLAEEESILNRIRRGEGVEHYQTVRRRKDGSLVPVSLSVSPVRDRRGVIIGASTIARDTSVQRAAEEALRKSEERFRAVFEQAAIGIGLVSFADARWMEVNEAFCRMLGYAAEELRATPWPEITHPEDVDLDLVQFRRMAAGQLESYTVEKRFIHKQGRHLWARLTLSLVRDLNGRPDYEIAIIEDVSERKEAEAALQRAKAELARANTELERKVRERTAKLQEAVGELEAFSYSLVHDLRAPLRAMQSYASILEEESGNRLDPESQEHVRRIKLAALRMDQLVTDALNYSKLMREELPLGPVNVGRLLRGMIETYPNLQPPHAQVRLEVDDLMVRGNEAALTQVFSNLLSNAAKFVAPGVTPVITIRVRPDGGTPDVKKDQIADPGDGQPGSGLGPSVLICVEDNGIGIPKEAQTKILGLFQRMHRPNEYPGTGAGLAIVRKALERIGGNLHVESEPGKGSRFCIELPPAESETVEPSL